MRQRWPRARVRAAAAVILLALTACGGSPKARGDDGAELRQLRTAADLPACPTGLSPELPALTLPCLSGGPPVEVARPGSGRPTLVNVWATWCPPCVREVPHLAQVARQARGQLDVVGVLTQDTPASALTFAREFDMPYTSVMDDSGKIMRKYSPGPPVTLFVAGDGTVRHVQRGEMDATTLRDLLDKHLRIRLSGSAEAPAPSSGTD